jgi:hypothetical protein
VTDVLFALSLLTPWDIDKPKVRIGPATDGGYVLVNDIASDQSIVSYGIHTEYRFEQEMARKGHDVFMFDHTIDGIQNANERMHFFKEGVAGQIDPGALLYTVDDHLSRHNILGDRLILKMDVEGCEFSSLLGMSDASLQRFDQLTIEFHDLHKLGDAGYRNVFIKMFQKLNRYFTLFHVHANNYDGPNTFHFIDGLPVSNLLELSYIKSERVHRVRSKTLYPTYLDYPNTPQLDKRLWIFPFFPTDRTFEEFASSWDRAQIQLKIGR